MSADKYAKVPKHLCPSDIAHGDIRAPGFNGVLVSWRHNGFVTEDGDWIPDDSDQQERSNLAMQAPDCYQLFTEN